jgi:fumarylacetoacetate (FAA) hydrolase family protein
MATKVSPAEVEKLLKGVDYPARKADLVKYVQQEMQQVLEILQKLPDETFQKPTDVARTLGEVESKSKGSTR